MASIGCATIEGGTTQEIHKGNIAEVREELYNIYASENRVSGSIEDLLARVVNQVVSESPSPYSSACDIGYYSRGTPMGDDEFGDAVVDKLLEYFVARETGAVFEWVG